MIGDKCGLTYVVMKQSGSAMTVLPDVELVSPHGTSSPFSARFRSQYCSFCMEYESQDMYQEQHG